MDGHIVGSMISANSITGEQIQANSIKTANLELSAQQKIQNATDEETVKALIKADLDGFESTLSKEFITVENATTQIQQATEVAVKEATQSIIDNAVSESMGAVDGQLNDKLNQYTSGTLLPAIAEKAEEVLQNAEDYVVTQLESYATKQELSSSISQTREQIELSVSKKYTTKTESATFITEAIDGITVGAINRVLGTGENKSFKFNGGANETWLPYKFSNDISDKEVFVSFKYTLTGTAQNGSQIEFAPSYLKKTNNQTVYRPKHVFFTSDRLQDVNITDTVSFTTKDFQDISSSSTSYIRFVGNGFTGTLSVSEAQIKQGNSKTSWSPAPEDTITDITNAKNDAIGSANNTLIATIANYYTKSETDSKISVAKDEINLGVSNKYETKANVETKVTSTLNSAKSYADTKKTEAINSAATDATSKVNAAKGELNTAISKKANTVDVYSKAEVYTKAQTDSAIKVAKDAINLGVSQTYETKANVESKINSIQIGGRNLLKGTSSSFKEFTMNEWYCLPYDYLLSDLGLKVGDKVAFKLYLKFGNTLCGGAARITFLDTAGTNIKSVNNAVSVKPNSEGYSEITTEIPANAVRIRVGVQRETAGNGLAYFNFQIKEPKLEQGTKCSTWSPAPEDVDSAINKKANTVDVYKKTETYTKTETDSQINVAKDAINLGVSQTYETKTNVASQVTSTLNSAKSYADTKKSEAISSASSDATTKANNALNSAKSYADTKKNEAISSANNTLNSTIANYYTKSQTDSQINVAKNAITSSVSSTYATKTDVTSSINGVNSSISNLQNRMNSAEQKITDSAIVSTVTNSSSWKTQTNNLNSALNKLSINEQTKINGLELLPQGYLTNDSNGYRVEYNATKWQNNRIEVTGREWISTDFIKLDRTKPLYWHINLSISSNNLFYFGIERFDKNKLTINGAQNNATHYLVNGAGLNGEWEGYWQETDTSTAYIRLRILCDWNATGTATTIIKSIKWKQLGASVTNDLANRMSSAESKITDTAITNTVKKNFYTKEETNNQITSKGYQTSSQVQQTVNNLQVKFTETGGYNLLRNSSGLNGTNLWTGTATLGTATNTTIGSACDKYMYLDNGTTTSERFAYSSRFKLKPSTTYTLTGWFHNDTKCPSFDVYVLSSTSVDGSNTGLSNTHTHHLIKAQNTNGSWKKYTVSFTTPSGCKSGIVRIDNNGYNANGSNSNRIHWSALILTEGALEVPWSPHPDEVYDGLTSIDKEGITVTASNVRSKTKMSADGFQLIRTTDNKKMFYVNQDGSLEMSGNFTQHDSNGKISIKIANNSYGCYDWLWDGDFVGNFGVFESNRTNTSGANQRFIGIANIADYGNQLILGVRSSPNSTNFNSYMEIDNTSLMHRDYVTFTANTGFKTNAIFRNPSNNNETGRIFGATNNHFFVTCNYNNQLRLGYEKNGSYYPGISIYRNDNTGAGCAIEYHADEVHHNNVVIEGFLSVKGQKNRLVATENFGDRLLNAYETAECYFGDINEAIIGEDGEVKVELDEVFLETVNTTETYHVFLTKYGEGDCYVSERHEKYFVIKGTPNLSVGFEIKAKQRGYEKERLKMTVDTSKSHQATSSEDEAGYTIDCETTINRA